MPQTSIRDTLTEQLKLLAERNKHISEVLKRDEYISADDEDTIMDSHAARICEIARLLASMDGGSI